MDDSRIKEPCVQIQERLIQGDTQAPDIREHCLICADCRLFAESARLLEKSLADPALATLKPDPRLRADIVAYMHERKPSQTRKVKTIAPPARQILWGCAVLGALLVVAAGINSLSTRHDFPFIHASSNQTTGAIVPRSDDSLFLLIQLSKSKLAQPSCDRHAFLICDSVPPITDFLRGTL